MLTSGLILCGRTGDGKTTTIYSMLNAMTAKYGKKNVKLQRIFPENKLISYEIDNIEPTKNLEIYLMEIPALRIIIVDGPGFGTINDNKTQEQYKSVINNLKELGINVNVAVVFTSAVNKITAEFTSLFSFLEKLETEEKNKLILLQTHSDAKNISPNIIKKFQSLGAQPKGLKLNHGACEYNYEAPFEGFDKIESNIKYDLAHFNKADKNILISNLEKLKIDCVELNEESTEDKIRQKFTTHLDDKMFTQALIDMEKVGYCMLGAALKNQSTDATFSNNKLKEIIKNEFKESDVLGEAYRKNKSLIHLWGAMDQMRLYGEVLAGQNIDKGVAIQKHAENLKRRLVDFLHSHSSINITNDMESVFKKEFKTFLHSKDKEMNTHREIWKPIIANIALAITVIGLVAIILNVIKNYLNKKPISMNNTLFFAQTHSQKCIEKISNLLESDNKFLNSYMSILK